MLNMGRKKNGRRGILPFRIPIFRVFYSLTYTILYLITLVFLAITPVSMIWSTIDQRTLQYTFMIGGTSVLTLIIAIFIYSSRLYTNRSVLSAVGKPYVPIEDGEVSNMVRRMIVKQLKRSAVIAWEGRPRDLYGEILRAEQEGLLPAESGETTREEYTVGSIIRVDPQNPPWGDVQHAGWSSPSHNSNNKYPGVQFAEVVAELPNLIEARAVSLAPSDPTVTPVHGAIQPADAVVVELLQRPANMAMREYLLQLSYLGLIQPPQVGHKFLSLYESARFSGQPTTTEEFNGLMTAFATLLSGMELLDKRIVEEIRIQNGDKSIDHDGYPSIPEKQKFEAVSPTPCSPASSLISPVTARENRSRAATPYLQAMESEESMRSVIHNSPDLIDVSVSPPRSDVASLHGGQTSSEASLHSDAGSVVRHRPDHFDS
ncbi:hypothetical protein TI39_contig291g00025 [Zymoseptoria brevis]|uniref:Defect at low temperature protein 1 n=1 Tax=Zymoseptoria brevis TaxID=1047168 RepID=A0A0F4GZ18_9PEZI|nr:hypothetical protein TI39_contig291g00025 [Zymoseptoria brevis]